VIPKPSRAIYPCQRVAFSLASGFMGYLASLFVSVLAFRKAAKYIRDYKYVIAFLFMCFGFIAIVWHLNLSSGKGYAWTPADLPNHPMGIARGIFPGRVVWMYDPDATSWDQSTGYWWEDNHIDQSVVSKMLSASIKRLTEKSTDSAAWEALFKYFNRNHGKGDIGYQPDEKIAIKLNLVNCDSHGTCDNASYTSPQIVLALLRQLVQNSGVPDSLITCYDVIRLVPSTIFERCHTEFPGVCFVDWEGEDGREKYNRETTCSIHWSEELNSEIGGGNATYLPTCVLEADYIINLANLKGHQLTGVTLCAKNHFGSIDADRDGTPYQYAPKAAGVHPYVAVHDFNFGPEWTFAQRDMETYNPLVDLMGHEHLGEKTLLFMIDGLYGAAHQGVKQREEYCKWLSSPFNNDWPSSLFVSQDGVAIESVGLDFLRSEPNMTEVYGNVDNYLHEAAQADNPPSGTFYDPEDDGTPLSSLGVHEHWNNAVDKKYSRNLGDGEGIELLALGIPWIGSPDSSSIDFNYGLVGESKAGQVKISNPGSVDLTVSSFDITGIDADMFICNQEPFSLSPGENKIVDVGFSPDTAGNYEAILNIDSDGGTVQITLHGKGMFAEPSILSITDVPEDQGNRVEVSWYASYYDFAEEMMYYTLWEKDLQNQWDSVGVMTATQKNPYMMPVPTFGNKTPSSEFWSLFKITANTLDSQIYQSVIDSGYSVDNIPPDVPTGLRAAPAGLSAIQLTWNEVDDDDLHCFKVFRGLEPDFDPSGIDPIAQTGDTLYTDDKVEMQIIYYYRICAVDVNENESGFSEPVSTVIHTSVPDQNSGPVQYALKQNYPNPFNASTILFYELPFDSEVILEIFNMRGQKVKTLVKSMKHRGIHRVIWDGSQDTGYPSPSGIYTYRLSASNGQEKYMAFKKMLFLK